MSRLLDEAADELSDDFQSIDGVQQRDDAAEPAGLPPEPLPIMAGEQDLFARHNVLNSVINYSDNDMENINQTRESYLNDPVSVMLEQHAVTQSYLTSIANNEMPWTKSEALWTMSGPWKQSSCFLFCLRTGEAMAYLAKQEADNLTEEDMPRTGRRSKRRTARSWRPS